MPLRARLAPLWRAAAAAAAAAATHHPPPLTTHPDHHQIRDLDDTHLFIDASAVKLVQEEIKRFTEENVYTAPDEKA